MRYILVNKPYEVLTQFTDEKGRATLKDFVDIPNIYPVGRLDYDSEGLVLLTDDKQLQHRLSEPRFKVPKTYWVQVEGVPTEEALENLRRGVDLKTGYTSPAEVELLSEEPVLWERSKPVRFRANIPTSWVQIRISQGMNRQVRKMTAAVGFPTLRLVRVSIADLKVAKLQPGQWRDLTAAEVKALTDDMAAQTAAAGTFKTPAKAEYWPGGIRPASAKPGQNSAGGYNRGGFGGAADAKNGNAAGSRGGRSFGAKPTGGKTASGKATPGKPGSKPGPKSAGRGGAGRKPGPAGGGRNGRG
ncbi:pseudouridine synthase [Hymenobacter taeanensis]|uniref:Pseudouridine synthase n=1 Tax=Hymenobacter taeanensis TaxID=2735321 RepID=A0A6M6BIW7_9BACT|nr:MULTISPECIES: pseudouridine synthase [Hymenobacter]QJX47744.1 pseudouridine synthase [Hymenobacter taeanensis]UOQ82770.1 pseudouridine synthase [Hymenobacter sp. 5414T-23]